MKIKIFAFAMLMLCLLAACSKHETTQNESDNGGSSYLTAVSEELPSINSQSESIAADSELPSVSENDALHNGSKLSLPVTNVSSHYAAPAEKILASFYCAGDIAPSYLFESSLNSVIANQSFPDYLKENNIRFYNEYCYYLYCIDPYSVDFAKIGEMIKNGVHFEKVLEYCQSESNDFYRNNINIGVLCGIPENGIVLCESQYTKKESDDSKEKAGSFFFYHKWDTVAINSSVPERALYLDDDLMEKLDNEGFTLDKTKALSVNIPTHSTGIYFSDGLNGKYYPLTLAKGVKLLSINEMADISVLAESLISHTFDAVH